MSDIHLDGIKYRSGDLPSNGKAASAENLQYWDYEWEKAYIEQEKENQKPQLQQHDTCVDVASQTGGNEDRPGKAAYKAESILVSERIDSTELDKGEPSQFTSIDVSTNAASVPASAGSQSNYQVGCNYQGQGTLANPRTSLEISPELTSAAPLKSTQWQTVPQSRAQTMGLLVYKTPEDELKVWLRDKSISEKQGMVIVKNLQKMLTGIGISLAAITLNGNIVKLDTLKTNFDINDEVVT